MIVGDPGYKDELNYVEISNGYKVWTNGYILIKSGIILAGKNLPEKTYIHVNEYKKIAKIPDLQYVKYENNIATFISIKKGKFECNASIDINYPDTDVLQLKDIKETITFNTDTLDFILKQMKFEKKINFEVQISSTGLCQIKDTEHKFMKSSL